MKKVLSCILALVMLLACLPMTLGLADEKVEITYMSWNTEDSYAKQIVDAFNASQDRIHVNYVSEATQGDAFQSKVLTLLAAEQGIDVLGIYNNELLQRYMDLGALAPLKELMATAQYDPSGLGACLSQLEVNGEYYSLPHRKSVEVLYYNKEILDEAGVEYPVQLTWDEFTELAKKLTFTRADGRKCVGAGGDLRFYATTATHALTAQYGEYVTDDELPHFKGCLERLNKIFNVDKSCTDFAEMLAMGNAGQTEVFVGGEMALFLSGDFMLSVLASKADDIKFEWNVAYLPYDPEGMEPGTSYGNVTSTAITSFSQHKAEAFEFLSYLCSQPGAKIIASTGTLPAYSDEEVQNAFRASQDASKNVDVFTTSNPMDATIHHAKSAELVEMQRAEVEMMLIGEQDVETTFANWDAQRREILAAE